MAVPNDVTLRNFYGQYVMNKQLSDETDKVLQLQDVGWILRQAVKRANIYITINQYTDDRGVVHIDIDQITTPGNFTNTEPRAVDGEWREKDDKIFGKVRGFTKWIKIPEHEDPFMRDGWEPKWLEESGGEGLDVYLESIGKKGGQDWTAEQIWGFEIINGERRFIIHIVVKRGETEYKVKTIYDYTKKP